MNKIDRQRYYLLSGNFMCIWQKHHSMYRYTWLSFELPYVNMKMDEWSSFRNENPFFRFNLPLVIPEMCNLRDAILDL